MESTGPRTRAVFERGPRFLKIRVEREKVRWALGEVFWGFRGGKRRLLGGASWFVLRVLQDQQDQQEKQEKQDPRKKRWTGGSGGTGSLGATAASC